MEGSSSGSGADSGNGAHQGWWLASDGNWYPPEHHPDYRAALTPAPGFWQANDGNWYPPEQHPDYRVEALTPAAGFWQANDGNWYPPELHPSHIVEHYVPVPGGEILLDVPTDYGEADMLAGYAHDGLSDAVPEGFEGKRVKMRRWWSWLGLNLGKRAGSVAVIGLAVSLALGLGLVKLSFVTSNASYLNKGEPAQVDNARYEALFGGDPVVTDFSLAPGTTTDNLFTDANMAAFAQMDARLRADPQVFSVVGPNDALILANALASSPTGSPTDSEAGKLLVSALDRDPSPTSKAARTAFLTKLLALESAIPLPAQKYSNPAWVHFLTHNPDGTLRSSVLAFIPNENHAEMIVALKGGLSIDQESAAARSVQAIISGTHFDNATTMTTGVPALLDTINSYLRGGMFSLTAIAAAIMVLILVLAFNVRWRLLPFAVVGIGLLWAFGLVGYLGIPLTLGSIAGLPILLGVGIDYAIQMHSRIEEEVILDRAAHPIQATARNLGPALLVVTFDAVFAFAALMFAKVPMIRQFGELLVVGIVAVCVFSIIGPLAFLGIREYRSPTRGKDFTHGKLSKLVVWLGSAPMKAAVPMAAASVLVLVGGLAVEGSLQLQTDPIQWVNPHSTAISNIKTLMSDTGAENELGVIVTTNQPFSDGTVAYVSTLSNQMNAQFSGILFPGVGLVNFVDQFLSAPGAQDVPPTGAQVQEVYGIAPTAIQSLMAANGGQELNVVFRARSSTLASVDPVVTYLQGHVSTPPGITVQPGGIATVGVGLLDNLAASRMLLTYLAILFVGTFLAIRLRSIIRSLLSLVPVLIAVGAVSLIAYAFDLKLSPMTAVAGPLVVAACTEFTSLILLRFVEERGRGLDPRQAVDVTAARTGRAFMVSAMTAVAGIGVMAASSMPLLRGFGIIVAMNVAIALLCALVILPPVLVWADQPERNWVSRRLAVAYEEPRAPDVTLQTLIPV